MIAQQSIHFVVGSDYNFTAWNRPFRYISELFYKRYSHLIPYQIDNVRIQYLGDNNAVGYAVGIDMKINGEFVPGVESWASVSLLKTKEDLTNDFYYKTIDGKLERVEPVIFRRTRSTSKYRIIFSRLPTHGPHLYHATQPIIRKRTPLWPSKIRTLSSNI
jgi:hypothetical protein